MSITGQVLIAGQGIAGSILALQFLQAGLDVHLACHAPERASSAIAAGVMNPVTGKRYAKSWRYDAFFPEAVHFYEKIAALAGQPVWYPLPIIRQLGSPLESNEWNLRAARAEMSEYMSTRTDAADWEGRVVPAEMYGVLQQAGRTDFEVVIQYTNDLFQKEGRLIAHEITTDAVPELLRQYERIIFCEGFGGVSNTFFPEIQWQPAKGDRLLIEIPDCPPIGYMFKKQIMVVPLKDNIFWAGANYLWDNLDEIPTAAGHQFIENELNTSLTIPFKIIDHKAAVRPVTKDRRPVMGWSSIAPAVGIFNGLGSKGALLAPFLASQFLQSVLQQNPIDSEVSLLRFR